jgi:hypothetical protein
MDLFKIVITAAALLLLAIKLYRKYIANKDDREDSESGSSDKSDPLSSAGDDYEPYSMK